MMREPWRGWLTRTLGAAFILSAVVNIFGVGEDIPAVFAGMAAANSGTRLASLSDWIAGHGALALGFAAAFMFLTGLAELFRTRLARLAALGQIVMMLAFVTLLHRAFPEVIFADGVLILAAALVPGSAPAAEHVA